MSKCSESWAFLGKILFLYYFHVQFPESYFFQFGLIRSMSNKHVSQCIFLKSWFPLGTEGDQYCVHCQWTRFWFGMPHLNLVCIFTQIRIVTSNILCIVAPTHGQGWCTFCVSTWSNECSLLMTSAHHVARDLWPALLLAFYGHATFCVNMALLWSCLCEL